MHDFHSSAPFPSGAHWATSAGPTAVQRARGPWRPLITRIPPTHEGLMRDDRASARGSLISAAVGSKVCFAPMILLFALVVGCASPRTTAADPFGPIRRADYLAVDGARLYVLTRGADRHAPVVLWLHGGPGGPERPLFRYFNGDLERHFVVAYWDQRGAGRSFDRKADPRRLTISRHLADLDAVVDHLRHVLGQDKIVLIGHSWGSALGLLYVQRHPEKVSAFIGVTPLVSLLKAQHAQYEFVSAEAASRKDEVTLTRLRQVGPPPHEAFDEQVAMEDLADRYAVVYRKKLCRICVIVRGMIAGLVSPWEFRSIHRGIHVSLGAMTPELLSLNLEHATPRVDVPVFFFLGRQDRDVDSTIAAAYFETLRAPRKQLIWFDDSAHNVPFEEPETFNEMAVKVLESVAIRRQRP
jgi:proline iminopeptidase